MQLAQLSTRDSVGTGTVPNQPSSYFSQANDEWRIRAGRRVGTEMWTLSLSLFLHSSLFISLPLSQKLLESELLWRLCFLPGSQCRPSPKIACWRSTSLLLLGLRRVPRSPPHKISGASPAPGVRRFCPLPLSHLIPLIRESNYQYIDMETRPAQARCSSRLWRTCRNKTLVWLLASRRQQRALMVFDYGRVLRDSRP